MTPELRTKLEGIAIMKDNHFHITRLSADGPHSCLLRSGTLHQTRVILRFPAISRLLSSSSIVSLSERIRKNFISPHLQKRLLELGFQNTHLCSLLLFFQSWAPSQVNKPCACSFQARNSDVSTFFSLSLGPDPDGSPFANPMANGRLARLNARGSAPSNC